MLWNTRGIFLRQWTSFYITSSKRNIRALHFKWDLHTAWRPQSSGQVERMNQTLKRQLTKICQEAQLKWPEALPIALMRIRIAPRAKEKVIPFELLYGKTYPINELLTKGSQMHVGGGGRVGSDNICCLCLPCSLLSIDMYRSDYQFHWMFRYTHSDLDIRY